MTKRIVRTNNMAIFKKLISSRYNGRYTTLAEDKELSDEVGKITPGCFVFVLQLANGSIEALAMHKFEYALSTMLNRETAFSLQMRYLSKSEMEGATKMLEPDNKEDVRRVIEAEKQWFFN